MRMDTRPLDEIPDPPGSPDETGDDNPIGAEIEAGLERLRQAAQAKHVDTICRAYVALRQAAGGMSPRDVLALADDRLQMPVAKLVISAYSHRRCYMCDDGTVTCEFCNGTCLDERGLACSQCDGLGLATCGFCGGTGWGDRAEVPRELAPAVAKRQLARVHNDLTDLQQSVAKLGREALDKMPPDRRGALAGRLIRIAARLEELGQCGICDETHTARIAELIERVGILLQALRR